MSATAHSLTTFPLARQGCGSQQRSLTQRPTSFLTMAHHHRQAFLEEYSFFKAMDERSAYLSLLDAVKAADDAVKAADDAVKAAHEAADGRLQAAEAARSAALGTLRAAVAKASSSNAALLNACTAAEALVQWHISAFDAHAHEQPRQLKGSFPRSHRRHQAPRRSSCESCRRPRPRHVLIVGRWITTSRLGCLPAACYVCPC